MIVSIEIKYLFYNFQCTMSSDCLPTDKFEKAELHYEDGEFKVTCFTSKFNDYIL